LLAGRLTRTPTIGHLHEAETEAHPLVRKALVAPLFLADAVIVRTIDARVDRLAGSDAVCRAGVRTELRLPPYGWPILGQRRYA